MCRWFWLMCTVGTTALTSLIKTILCWSLIVLIDFWLGQSLLGSLIATHLRCLCCRLTWSTSNNQISCRIKAWSRTWLSASLLLNTGANFVLGSPWPLCVSLFCFLIIQPAVRSLINAHSFSVWPASLNPSYVAAINVILAGRQSVSFLFPLTDHMDDIDSKMKLISSWRYRQATAMTLSFKSLCWKQTTSLKRLLGSPDGKLSCCFPPFSGQHSSTK